MKLVSSHPTTAAEPSSFADDVRRIREAIELALRTDGTAASFGHGVYQLGDHGVLCLPRLTGDSRRPYGRDGSNFWAYSSGYMHANDGLFSIFPKRTEGQEPPVAFFAGVRDGAE